MGGETPPYARLMTDYCRAKMEHLTRYSGLEPESEGQNLALAVLYGPCSLDSGKGFLVQRLP